MIAMVSNVTAGWLIFGESEHDLSDSLPLKFEIDVPVQAWVAQQIYSSGGLKKHVWKRLSIRR